MKKLVKINAPIAEPVKEQPSKRVQLAKAYLVPKKYKHIKALEHVKFITVDTYDSIYEMVRIRELGIRVKLDTLIPISDDEIKTLSHKAKVDAEQKHQKEIRPKVPTKLDAWVGKKVIAGIYGNLTIAKIEPGLITFTNGLTCFLNITSTKMQIRKPNCNKWFTMRLAPTKDLNKESIEEWYSRVSKKG